MFRSKRARIGAGVVAVAMIMAVIAGCGSISSSSSARAVVEHAGGRGVVDHFDFIVVGRVGHPDGDLLLQPEPVWGRVAEGRAAGGREAGHQARRLRRQQRPADAVHADPGRDHHRQVQGLLGLGPERRRPDTDHQQGDRRRHQGRGRRLHLGTAVRPERPDSQPEIRHDRRSVDRRGVDEPDRHDERGVQEAGRKRPLQHRLPAGACQLPDRHGP